MRWIALAANRSVAAAQFSLNGFQINLSTGKQHQRVIEEICHFFHYPLVAFGFGRHDHISGLFIDFLQYFVLADLQELVGIRARPWMRPSC